MRKIKAWSLLFVISLCVMIFSGCGGSADSTEETEDEDTIDTTTAASTFTGTWIFDETSGYNGKTSYNNKNIRLWSVKGFTMSFSDMELSGTSPNINGTANVFYSFVCTALDEDGSSLGTVSINSDSTSGSVVEAMTVSQVNDTKWTFSSENCTITITLISESEFTLQWNVPAYIPGLNATCDSVIMCSFTKTSDIPAYSNVDQEDVVTDNSDIEKILTGTWKVNTENQLIEIDFQEGGEMLLISSDITFTDVNINGDVGTAGISFDQYWRVEWTDENENKHLGYTSIALHDKTIRMARTDSEKWRCDFNSTSTDDTESAIMSGTVLNISIASDSKINVIHDGIVAAPSYENTFITYNQAEFDYIKE